MPNLHSHAFQRAMALTEYRANPSDSFWSWRDLMYRFALKITPDALAAIARWLYVEMLAATRRCANSTTCTTRRTARAIRRSPAPARA